MYFLCTYYYKKKCIFFFFFSSENVNRIKYFSRAEILIPIAKTPVNAWQCAEKSKFPMSIWKYVEFATPLVKIAKSKGVKHRVQVSKMLISSFTSPLWKPNGAKKEWRWLMLHIVNKKLHLIGINTSWVNLCWWNNPLIKLLSNVRQVVWMMYSRRSKKRFNSPHLMALNNIQKASCSINLFNGFPLIAFHKLIFLNIYALTLFLYSYNNLYI